MSFHTQSGPELYWRGGEPNSRFTPAESAALTRPVTAKTQAKTKENIHNLVGLGKFILCKAFIRHLPVKIPDFLFVV
jgi:hypothetical protein